MEETIGTVRDTYVPTFTVDKRETKTATDEEI